jgi:sec-independent protein translocase protein TatB
VFDLSVLKIAVLAVLAVVVFGPDKLPKMVADASRFIRAVQSFARTSTQEITRHLPPEFHDLTPGDLHPRALAGRLIEEAMADPGTDAGDPVRRDEAAAGTPESP